MRCQPFYVKTVDSVFVLMYTIYVKFEYFCNFGAG